MNRKNMGLIAAAVVALLMLYVLYREGWLEVGCWGTWQVCSGHPSR